MTRTDPEPSGAEARLLADDGTYPNNPELPLLLYRGAFPDPDPEAIEALFADNGWPPAWRFGVLAHHHYHSTAHEALGCFAGTARIQFGGPAGPVLEVGAGDVAVLPAGTAHRAVEAHGGFRCVGAYPAGQRPDMNQGRMEERPAAVERIAAVPVPEADPVYGPGGPMARHWAGA